MGGTPRRGRRLLLAGVVAAAALAACAVPLLASLRTSRAAHAAIDAVELDRQLQRPELLEGDESAVDELRLAAGRLVPRATDAAVREAAEELYARLGEASTWAEELRALFGRRADLDAVLAAAAAEATEAAGDLLSVFADSPASRVDAVEVSFRLRQEIIGLRPQALQTSVESLATLRDDAVGEDLEGLDAALHAVMRLQDALTSDADRRKRIEGQIAALTERLSELARLGTELSDAARRAAETAARQSLTAPPVVAAAALLLIVTALVFLLRQASRWAPDPERPSAPPQAAPSSGRTQEDGRSAELLAASRRVSGLAESLSVLARETADRTLDAAELRSGREAVRRIRVLCLNASLWGSRAPDERIVDAASEAARLCERILTSPTLEQEDEAADGTEVPAGLTARLEALARVGFETSRLLSETAAGAASRDTPSSGTADAGGRPVVDLGLSPTDEDLRLRLGEEHPEEPRREEVEGGVFGEPPSAPDLSEEDFENL